VAVTVIGSGSMIGSGSGSQWQWQWQGAGEKMDGIGWVLSELWVCGSGGGG
jgi:hypothetical protein